MNADLEQVLAEAEARVQELADQARREVDAVIDRVQQQIDGIEAEIRATTGLDVEIPWDPSPRAPTVMDATLGEIAVLAAGARHLLSAARLMGGHVRHGSELTVGALVKTRLERRRSDRVLDHLNRSGFFADCEGAGDG